MNRNYLIILIGLLFVAAVVSGCSDETPTNPVRGKVYYEIRPGVDTTYTFSQAIFGDYGPQDNDTIFDFDFRMVSLGIKTSKDTAIGTGNYINFELESPNKLSPVPGIYKFDRKPTELGINNIIFGEFYDSLNFQTGQFVRGDTITGGTLVFTKNGSGIIVTIDCTTQLGKALKGTYAGDATYYDFRDKKKKK